VGRLAAFTAVFLWDGPPSASGVALHGKSDSEAASFARCSGPVRTDCVVDGDTFWYSGEKFRIADINTPELSEPQCGREAELAERATLRLTQLLNAGPFTLEPVERETDRYGRTLRVIRRGGESLGLRLVTEGLAEHWKGYRSGWC
jgi:micrococcal nuclease